MLNFNSLILFSSTPGKLGEYYKKLLNKDPDWKEGDFMGFQAGAGHIVIGPHDKVNGMSQNPERVIFQFESSDFQKEFKRIEDLGTKVIAKPYKPMEAEDMWLATFADPDGNYFQLGTPMK
jgi:predicted enzyme related to lactoylglutathione lyase